MVQLSIVEYVQEILAVHNGPNPVSKRLKQHTDETGPRIIVWVGSDQTHSNSTLNERLDMLIVTADNAPMKMKWKKLLSVERFSHINDRE